MAVSPPYMYSIVRATSGSTQPVPVGVTATSTARSNAPVRSNSAIARSTRSSTESAESSSTYTRIGSSAGTSRSNDSISGVVGAPATKFRPSNPNVSQSTSDAGLPDEVGDVGGSTPSAVVSSKVPKFVSAQLAKRCAAKLETINRLAVTIAATVQPAARCRIRFATARSMRATRWRRSRAISMISALTSAVRTSITGAVVHDRLPSWTDRALVSLPLDPAARTQGDHDDLDDRQRYDDVSTCTGDGRRSRRRADRSTTRPTKPPSPYPTATQIALMTAWIRADRGNIDGLNDNHHRTSTPALAPTEGGAIKR